MGAESERTTGAKEPTRRLESGADDEPAEREALGRAAASERAAVPSAGPVASDRSIDGPSPRTSSIGRLARLPASTLVVFGAAVVAAGVVLALALLPQQEPLEELTLSRIAVVTVERSTLRSVPVGSRCVVRVAPRTRRRRLATVRGYCAVRLTCDGATLRAYEKELVCGWARRDAAPAEDPPRGPALELRDDGWARSGVRWSYDAAERTFLLRAHGGSASLREMDDGAP